MEPEISITSDSKNEEYISKEYDKYQLDTSILQDFLTHYKLKETKMLQSTFENINQMITSIKNEEQSYIASDLIKIIKPVENDPSNYALNYEQYQIFKENIEVLTEIISAHKIKKEQAEKKLKEGEQLNHLKGYLLYDYTHVKYNLFNKLNSHQYSTIDYEPILFDKCILQAHDNKLLESIYGERSKLNYTYSNAVILLRILLTSFYRNSKISTETSIIISVCNK